MSGNNLNVVYTAQTADDDDQRIPFDYDSTAPAIDAKLIKCTAAMGLGGSAAVSLGSGAPFVDVLTSMQGGFGAAMGYAAGAYVKPILKVGESAASAADYAPLIGATVVPFVASGGVLDKNLLFLVGGGYVAALILKSA